MHISNEMQRLLVQVPEASTTLTKFGNDPWGHLWCPAEIINENIRKKQSYKWFNKNGLRNVKISKLLKDPFDEI